MTGSTLMPHMRMPVARKIMPPQAVKSVMTALSITRDAGAAAQYIRRSMANWGRAMHAVTTPSVAPKIRPLNKSRTALTIRMPGEPVSPSVMAPISPMLPKQNAETSVTRWGARFLSAFLREPKSSRA